VLLLGDTTTLNYPGLREVDGLGPIASNPDKTRGLFVHPHFCLDTLNGEPLGLHGERVWSRDPEDFGRSRTGKGNRLPLAEKESGRWLDAWTSAEKPYRDLGATREIICVSDREGDIYEIFAHRQRVNGGAHLLVRQQHDRALAGAGADTQQHSRAHLQQQKSAGEIDIKIEARAGRRSREARLEVRHARVELAAKENAVSGKVCRAPLSLWIVSAVETGPPTGEPPVEWYLWSTRPAESFEHARELLHYHSQRRQIEILFRVYIKPACLYL
jgi:hypothetical protein